MIIVTVVSDLTWSEKALVLINSAAVEKEMLYRTLEEIAGRIAKGELVGAFVDGEIVGVCLVQPWDGELRDSLVEIGGVVVDPRFRHHGIGTALIQLATELVHRDFPQATVFCLADASNRPDTAVGPFQACAYLLQPNKRVLPDAVWAWCPQGGCDDWKEGRFPDCKCRLMIHQ